MVYHFGDGMGRQIGKAEVMVGNFYPLTYTIRKFIGMKESEHYLRKNSAPDWGIK